MIHPLLHCYRYVNFRKAIGFLGCLWSIFFITRSLILKFWDVANARVVFAMSEAKSFFPWAGKVHSKFKTPGNSVLILGVWSCLFVLSGSFDILADMFIFMSWVFYGLVVAGVFILRKKMANMERPYRVKGYPILPAVFILFTGFYLATTVYNDVDNYAKGKVPFINSFFGMLLTAIGIPLYYYFKRKKPGN